MNESDILYKGYTEALENCGTWLLEADDVEISFRIYEEFDIDIVTYFYIENLKKIYENGLISKEKLNNSIHLNELWNEIQNTEEWDIKYFKTSEKWLAILSAADEIKEMK